ncbi:unnamed protein product [Dicrocoelium dendriticum]|nr:unnamed protein product [Dicrocoelium dendriticum]
MSTLLLLLAYFVKIIQDALSLQVVYSLKDETPADSFVGNLAESLQYDYKDSLAFVLMTSKKFRYFSDFFRVSHNGDLHTLRRIDRDNTNEICGPLACCLLPVCTLQANIIANVLTDTHMGDKTAIAAERKKWFTGLTDNQLEIDLVIRINDVNDNAPQFEPSSYATTFAADTTRQQSNVFHIYIREGEATSSETLPIAFDADSQPNGVVEYRLIQTINMLFPESPPSLNISVAPSSVRQPRDEIKLKMEGVPILTPKLIQTRSLDFETPSDRELHALLLAVDGGDPQLTGTLSIVVNLLDINDNSPVFVHPDEDLYVTVPENSTLKGESIFVIKATDADSGDNGKVTYMLSPLAGVDVARKFSVDSSTGDIRIRHPLDYEIYSERHFVLPLIAKDSGSPQRSCTASIFIKVQDVNDNVPSLVVQENVTVPEGEFLTKPVLKFYIKDEDEASHGKVKCELSATNEDQNTDPELMAGSRFLRLHGVSDTVFFVFLKHLMDYEETPRASLLLVCVDLADVGESESGPHHAPNNQLIRITVAVKDKNDNAPRFVEEKYFVKMAEHAPQGALVTIVQATDADSDEFGSLVYSLGSVSMGQATIMPLPPTQHMFRVDPTTGRIDVLHSASLDRELAELIYVKVVASDKGGLSTTAELVIALSDINDMAPTLSGPKEFRLRENQRVDTIIGHVRFVDRDVGRNARIRLAPRLRYDNIFDKYVRLVADPKFQYVTPTNRSTNQHDLTGDGEVRAILVSQMPVDRETYAALFLEVVASDEGDPANTAVVTITIHVDDENDNAPVPIFPLPDTTIGYHPPVHSNTPFGTVVTRLRAVDADQAENGTVLFRINPGTNGSKLFNLNTTSGELTTAWVLDQMLQRKQRISRMEEAAGSPLNKPVPGVYLLEVMLTDKGVPANTFLNRFYVNIDPPDLADGERIADNRFVGVQHNPLPRVNISTNYVLWAIVLLLSLFVVCTGMAIIFWIRVCKRAKRMRPIKHSFPIPIEGNQITGPQDLCGIRTTLPYSFDTKDTILGPTATEFYSFPQSFEHAYGTAANAQSFNSSLDGSLKRQSRNALSLFTSGVPTFEADPIETHLVHEECTSNTIFNNKYRSAYSTSNIAVTTSCDIFVNNSEISTDTAKYRDFIAINTFPNGYTASPMSFGDSVQLSTMLNTPSKHNGQYILNSGAETTGLPRTTNFLRSPVHPIRCTANFNCSSRDHFCSRSNLSSMPMYDNHCI